MTSALFQLDVLPFAIALGVGLVLAVGAVLGFAGDGASAEDGDSSDAVLSALPRRSSLPISIRVLVYAWSFGAVGAALQFVLTHAGLPLLPRALVANVGAAAVAALLERGMRRALRHFPLYESYATMRRALLGTRGLVVVRVSERGGMAQVRDRAGDLHQIACRTTGEALEPGARVLVVDLDEEARVFLVEPDPL